MQASTPLSPSGSSAGYLSTLNRVAVIYIALPEIVGRFDHLPHPAMDIHRSVGNFVFDQSSNSERVVCSYCTSGLM
jgi:hypothetical protein